MGLGILFPTVQLPLSLLLPAQFLFTGRGEMVLSVDLENQITNFPALTGM